MMEVSKETGLWGRSKCGTGQTAGDHRAYHCECKVLQAVLDSSESEARFGKRWHFAVQMQTNYHVPKITLKHHHSQWL